MGRYCGEEGSWKSVFSPDTWPPIVPPGARSAKFYKACQKHDTCYDSLGANRDQCDKQFLEDLQSECKMAFHRIIDKPMCAKCLLAARSYYEAVRSYPAIARQLGKPDPFTNAQNEACRSLYRIASKQTGMCLDVAFDTQDGGRVYQWQDNGNDNNCQKWRFVKVEDDYYRIVSEHSGKCLDIANESHDGGKIWQWSDNQNDNDNQKWRLILIEPGLCRIVSKATGKCLDAASEQNNGGKVWMWSNNGNDNDNQKWYLRKL